MLRFVSMLALMAVAPAAIAAGVPTEINHQGVITVNELRFTGDGHFYFALVDLDTETNLWTSDGTNLAPSSDRPISPVHLDDVVNGVYSVRLGSTDAERGIAMPPIPPSVFNDDNVVLRIWFDDTQGNGIQQLSPDQPLTTSPYAFRAAHANDAAKLGGLPPAQAGSFVGMIVPFFHPDLAANPDLNPYDFFPENWVLCDGKVVDGSHPQLFTVDDVSPAFWAKAVPDLTARFPRGVANGQTLGTTGGADAFTAPSHRHSGPSHRHGLPLRTGSIANGGGSTGVHPYLVIDDNQGWTRTHLVNGGGSPTEGQHRHDLGGVTAFNGTGQTGFGGVHVAPTVPRYVAVQYIIRIK